MSQMIYIFFLFCIGSTNHTCQQIQCLPHADFLVMLHIFLSRFPLWWIGAKYVAGGSSFLVSRGWEATVVIYFLVSCMLSVGNNYNKSGA